MPPVAPSPERRRVIYSDPTARVTLHPGPQPSYLIDTHGHACELSFVPDETLGMVTDASLVAILIHRLEQARPNATQVGALLRAVSALDHLTHVLGLLRAPTKWATPPPPAPVPVAAAVPVAVPPPFAALESFAFRP